jgi:hypothetical protein
MCSLPAAAMCDRLPLAAPVAAGPELERHPEPRAGRGLVQAGVPGGIPNRTTIFKTLAPGVTAEQISAGHRVLPERPGRLPGPGDLRAVDGDRLCQPQQRDPARAGADQTFLVFTGSVERREHQRGHQHRELRRQPSARRGQVRRGAEQHRRLDRRLFAGGHRDHAQQHGPPRRGQERHLPRPARRLRHRHRGRVGEPEAGISAVEGRAAPAARAAPRCRCRWSPASTGTGSPSPRASTCRTGGQQSPGAWWADTVVSGDGVEDLSIDHADSGAKSGIQFFNAYGCWVKGIRDINSNRNHVWLFLTTHSVVRDSYFYGTQNSIYLSYGVELFMGTDDLVENNIFQHIVSPMITNGSGPGASGPTTTPSTTTTRPRGPGSCRASRCIRRAPT